MQVPAGLPSDLLQRRPDIVVAEQDLHAATARIGVAQAERFPNLTLTGLLGVASPQLSNLLTGSSQFGAVGLGLAGPILSAQTLGFEKQAAEAQAKQALASYEKSVLVAFKEVDDALVSIKTSSEQVEAQEAQVKALRSALNLAEKRYQGGLASYLDVLLARRNLFDSELALTSTRRLRLVAVVQVYKALGGGWPSGGADPARSAASPAPPAEPAGK
jgi:multidrug efflux system outer membrane protein